MDLLRISKDCFVPKDNVKLITSYTPYNVKLRVRAMKKENQVFDLTLGKKINTAIFLKTGEVVLTSYVIDTISARFSDDTKTGEQG